MNTTKIGQIINTHGIRGVVKIYPYTFDIHRFSKTTYLLVGEELTKLLIESVEYRNNLVFVKFKDLNNINEVLKFKTENVYIYTEDRITLPEDHYFVSDLIGCKMIDFEGNYLGDIVDVLSNSANDLYVLKDKNNKEHLIPAVKAFIKKVDIHNKTVLVDLIEGMIN